MAIAYFIPDQTKLLAASSNTNTGSQTSTNNNSTNNHTTTTSSNQSHTPTPNNTNGAHSEPSGGVGTLNHNNNFRANITIPLSAYSATTAHNDAGCWDLLTQIFCHALRFCHQYERHPAVIQISFEISSSGTNGETTVQVGAAAPVQQTQQSEQVQQQENLTATHSPTLVVHSTAVPRCTAHTQTQQSASDAVSSERTTDAAPVVASTASTAAVASATVARSIDLEPGTHKPSAKRN